MKLRPVLDIIGVFAIPLWLFSLVHALEVPTATWLRLVILAVGIPAFAFVAWLVWTHEPERRGRSVLSDSPTFHKPEP